jgi:hypothetical protein
MTRYLASIDVAGDKWTENPPLSGLPGTNLSETQSGIPITGYFSNSIMTLQILIIGCLLCMMNCWGKNRRRAA